jgi:hypothetical protein
MLQSPRQPHSKPAARTSIELQVLQRKSLQRDLLLELLATGLISLFHRLGCWLHDLCPPEVLCCLLRWCLLQSPRQTLAGPLSLPAIANKALTVISAAAKQRGPLRPLNLSTLRLFIQREAPFSVPSRSCCPVSSRDGSSSAAQFRSRAVISDRFGHRFRSRLAFVAASASNSVH